MDVHDTHCDTEEIIPSEPRQTEVCKNCVEQIRLYEVFRNGLPHKIIWLHQGYLYNCEQTHAEPAK